MSAVIADEAQGVAETEVASAPIVPSSTETIGTMAVLLGAVLIWRSGATGLDISHITDVGIVSALNLQLVLGPFLVAATFVFSLWRGHSTWVLAAETLVFVVVLFATGPIVEPVTGFHVAWRHAGVTDHIARGLGIDPAIDVYFNWPAFFIVTAWVSNVLGVANPIDIAAWSPVLYNVAYLLPIYMLGKTLVADRRVLWLGIWFFFLGNWIGQDYFSPQGVAFFGYLLILALAVKYLLVDDRDGDGQPKRGSQQLYSMLGIVATYLLLVPTHQLTPIVALFVIAAMALFRLGVPAALPVFMVVTISVWWTFMASDFLSGNLPEMVEQIGRFDALAGADVNERVGGSAGHQWVVRIRVLSALATWGLAGLGWFAVRRRSRGSSRTAVLAIIFFVPFLLLPLASYGGEMVLRVFLFTLPGASFLAADFIGILAAKRPKLFWAAAASSLAVLLVLFPITKYGNESTNLFTEAEVELVDAAYELAPDGSAMIAAVDNLPWKYREYDLHKHILLERYEPLLEPQDLANEVALIAADRPAGSTVLVLNRVQYHHLEVFGIWPVGTLEAMTADLLSSGTMEIAFENAEGIVLKSVGP